MVPVTFSLMTALSPFAVGNGCGAPALDCSTISEAVASFRDFQKRNNGEYERLVAKVAAEAFDDVIPRFHFVRGVAIDPKIFTFSGKVGAACNTIELTTPGRQFLIDYRKLVDYVAVSGWVRFTEDFTSAPKLHDKIGGTNAQRRAVSQWRKSLVEIQSGKCFYDESHEMSSPEVDHVLPWEVAKIIGERMKLETHRVGGEGTAGQPRPFDRTLAFLDPLLAG